MTTTHVDHDPFVAEAEPPSEPEGAQMTLVEHLAELRRRLFICVGAIVVTSVTAFFFRGQLTAFLRLPLQGVYGPLVVTGIGEALTVIFKVSLGVGIAAATPIWLWQLWGFISPALTRREKRYALPFTLIGVLLFAAGLAVGFLTLRFPVTWLISFGQDSGFKELISADSYFSFVTFFMLAFGVTFELPLVMTFMSLVGIISSKKLAKNRPFALVSLWALSTIITPGADPYSPIILGASLTLLYFISEVLIRIIGK